MLPGLVLKGQWLRDPPYWLWSVSPSEMGKLGGSHTLDMFSGWGGVKKAARMSGFTIRITERGPLLCSVEGSLSTQQA